jgi:hypothetical protein
MIFIFIFQASFACHRKGESVARTAEAAVPGVAGATSTEVKRFSPPDSTSAPRLTIPAHVWNRRARERRDEKPVSLPAGHRPLPGLGDQETGQIEQREPSYEPADGSQDACYHRSPHYRRRLYARITRRYTRITKL